MCAAVGTNPIETDEIIRVSSKNKNNDTIIVKCKKTSAKNELFKSMALFRKQNKTLNLNSIGFNSNAPIYINERLTKYNYQILQAALKAKKKIKAAYTFRGFVYVKNENGKSTPVRYIEDLELLDPSKT